MARIAQERGGGLRVALHRPSGEGLDDAGDEELRAAVVAVGVLVVASPSHPKSRVWAAFHGRRSRSAAFASAIAASRFRMRPSAIGIGFSHHRVPSLSKTATRSSGGTAVALS